tara:strand:+ start:6634 stop:7953 length:1320 start_codon:yes stop_codon:yes gene_type:complete
MDLIKKINLLLVYSMPLFLIFSHSIADAIVVFTGLTFLILLSFNKLFITIKSLLRDKVIISLFLFYIILVFSSFLAEFQSLSFKRSIPYIRFIFFVAAMKYWLLTDKNSIKILIYAFVACLLFVCFDVIYQYFNYKYVPIHPVHPILGNSPENLIKKGFDIFGYPSKNYYRFQGPFEDEYIAGSFILRLSPFLFLVAFSIYKFKENNFSKILIFLSAALIIYSIYITGDRAPFFILFLISTILILCLFNKKIILIFLSSLILIIFLAGLNLDKKNRYLGESLSALGFQNNEFTLDTGYGHLFYSAIKIWIDKPFIGAGTKNYRKICYRKEYNFETKNNHQLCSTHPHNYVLELLSETGLLGLISFYCIFFYLLREFDLVKKVLEKNLNYINTKFSLLSLILILWPISTTGSILTNKNSIILWLIFGLTYSALNIEKKTH